MKTYTRMTSRIVPARAPRRMLLAVKRPVEAFEQFEASQLREPDRLRGRPELATARTYLTAN